jgi:hypothetical protein
MAGPRAAQFPHRAGGRKMAGTDLKIVASEDGSRAAGAQEPEFTGSK